MDDAAAHILVTISNVIKSMLTSIMIDWCDSYCTCEFVLRKSLAARLVAVLVGWEGVGVLDVFDVRSAVPQKLHVWSIAFYGGIWYFTASISGTGETASYPTQLTVTQICMRHMHIHLLFLLPKCHFALRFLCAHFNMPSPLSLSFTFSIVPLTFFPCTFTYE